MISIGKINREFEYLSETDNDGDYGGTWKFERQSSITEIFFTSKNKKITNNQIKNFNSFLSKYNKIRIEAESFISDDLKRKKYRNYEDFLKANFEFDIITVFDDNNESDIEIICSKKIKKLFWNKTIDYVIFIKDFKVYEIIKFGE